MKICSKCKTEKPVVEFSKNLSKPDRLQSRCKACEAARMSAYYAVNLDRVAAYKAAYGAANRDKIAAYASAYYAANRDKLAARSAAYHAANPEKTAQHKRNRRAMKRRAEGKHTASDVRAIFEAQRGMCANCQTKLFKSGSNKYHVDHVIPLALGGSNDKYNLQCLCPVCNLRKSAKHPAEWARQQGKLL